MTRLPLAVAVALSLGPQVVFAQSTPPLPTQPPSVLAWVTEDDFRATSSGVLAGWTVVPDRRIQFGARTPVSVSRTTRSTDVEFARFGRGRRETLANTQRRDAAMTPAAIAAGVNRRVRAQGRKRSRILRRSRERSRASARPR